MQALIPRKECVFIPIGSDRGDCPYCSDGVLVRDYEEEGRDRLRKERYRCDICGRVFIEGMNLIKALPWTRHHNGSLHRFFVDAGLAKEFGQ